MTKQETYTVIMEDESEHSTHTYFSDMSCPCHTDEENIAETNQYVQDGLMSVDDADRSYRGQTL